MIDLRILAVGAMALLMAAYGAFHGDGPRALDKDVDASQITGSIASKSSRIAPARVGTPGRIDGYDLTH